MENGREPDPTAERAAEDVERPSVAPAIPSAEEEPTAAETFDEEGAGLAAKE